MHSLCTSFWFWFVMLTSGFGLVASAFCWGWSLSKRNTDFVWERRVKSLHEKWEREMKNGSTLPG